MNDTLLLSTLVSAVVLLILLIVYCLGIRKKVAQNTIELDEKTEEVANLRATYSTIIHMDDALELRRQDIFRLNQQILTTQSDYDALKVELSEDYLAKRSIYDTLLYETSLLESKLEDISYGLYTPVYNYTSSEEYKAKLEVIRARLKELIKEDKAVYCPLEWTVGGSRAEGKRMTKQQSKLMLRAFNGECDSAIARVSWNNIGNIEMRISKAYEAINKLGSVNQINITSPYFDLKIAEMRLEYELQEKLHAEREEQRMVREQMREEEKALREIEQAQRKAEDEEAKYQKALLKATEEAKRATGEQLASLDQKIIELEQLLAQAQLQKERALSMAQQTKSGHVYVISNIGSFGEDVFKIGMTRRLEPMDRVRELGDASVPFNFDVHALVYSNNAPDLEYRIHRRLMDRRINLINNRREFFRVSLSEVETIFADADHPLVLTKLAEAKEFRETLAIKEAANKSTSPATVVQSVSLPLTLD